MNFNSRLVDSSRNPLARELLRSADLDDPPPQSMTRLAVALGLGSSALITSLAGSATATTGIAANASVAASATGISAVTGTSATFGVASGGAVVSSAGGVTAAAAAAPVVASSVTALGMLKAMAIVSLTCGTLSFGGTKLAMSIAEKPAASGAVTTRETSAARTVVVRQTNAGSVTERYAAPPAPPEPANGDEGQLAPLPELQPSNVPNATTGRDATERNVGRQDIHLNIDEVADVSASAQRASVSVVAASNSLAEARVSAVAAFPSDDETPPAAAVGNTTAKNPARSVKSTNAIVDTDLEREVVLLDRARGALASGQPLVALQALEAYRTQAHAGKLRAESVVLRVKALLALGQHSAAVREASPLLNAAPQSRHAARLRELLGVPANAP